MSFVSLLRREPRALAFGFLYTAAATVGQTFLISLFLPGIKASLELDDAAISLLFTLATLASAAALWKLGAWIDRGDLLRYALSCAILLAVSCALIAASTVIAALAAGLFCLRLAGNGLLTHVAVTATARHFSGDRGRALAIVLLGTSLGEGLLPAALVPLIGAWGWRWALLALGCLGLGFATVGAHIVRRQAQFRRPMSRASDLSPAPLEHTRPERERSDRRYFVLTAPLFAAMWMFITAAIFHQALVAEAKGVSLQWFAVSFVAFAAVRVPVSVLTGRMIDRIGSAWLFCLHLAPLAVGTVALIVVDSAWVAPVYWLCAGITSGMGAVVQSTVVAERVPRERLGTARSILGAAGIVASAAGPSLYGYALAAGAGVAAILWASVAFFVAATALGVIAPRSEARPRRGRTN
jgi:MFS family permease